MPDNIDYTWMSPLSFNSMQHGYQPVGKTTLDPRVQSQELQAMQTNKDDRTVFEKVIEFAMDTSPPLLTPALNAGFHSE